LQMLPAKRKKERKKERIEISYQLDW